MNIVRPPSQKAVLAVVYLDLPNCPSARREEIAKCLLSITRNDHMILVVLESSFALICPGMDRTRTAIFTLGLMNLFRGNFPDTLFRLNIAAYPEICTTLDELEAAAPKPLHDNLLCHSLRNTPEPIFAEDNKDPIRIIY